MQGINKLSPIIEIVVLLRTMVVCDVPHEAPWTTLVQWRFGAEMNCRPIDPPHEEVNYATLDQGWNIAFALSMVRSGNNPGKRM